MSTREVPETNFPRRAVISLVTAIPALLAGVSVNLLTAIVSTSWIHSWSWLIAIVLALVVAIPAFYGARRRWPDHGEDQGIRALATTSDGSGRLEFFVVQGPRLFHATYRPDQGIVVWSDLQLPKPAWDVAATVTKGDLLECFAVCNDGTVWRRQRDHDQWGRWRPVKAHHLNAGVSKISALSGWPEHRELFVVTRTGEVAHTWQWDGNTWDDWAGRGLDRCRDIATSVHEPGTLDCYAANSSGGVQHCWYIDGAWSDWQDWGQPDSGSAVVAIDAYSGFDGHQELFVVGADGQLAHQWYTPEDNWSGWAAFESPAHILLVTAGSTSAKRMHCFAADDEGRLWMRPWEARRWGGWQRLGAPFEATARP